MAADRQSYESWVADVMRLLKNDKFFDEHEASLARQLWVDRYDPANAVCIIQDIRYGGDGIDDGTDG